MDNLKYVQLAVCADKTRFNLCSVYRDKNHFIATDGSRLHMANSLPDMQPHYIDNLDAQFPDVWQVIPRSTPIGQAHYDSKFHGKEVLKTLKAILKLTDHTWHKITLICVSGIDLKLALMHNGLSLTYQLVGWPYLGQDIEVCLNLDYFIDAISYLAERPCTINLYSELGPIKIESNDLSAIVMPLKK